MSDARPPTSPAETQTDDDAAFTAALYSRIRGDEPPAAPADVSIDVETRPHADATLQAHQWSAARNEHDMTAPPLSKPSVAPPAFVARVRTRLQRELQGVSEEARTSARSDTGPSPAPSPPHETFQGFLAKLETELASHYDRVLQDDLPPLQPSEPRAAPTWSAALQQDVAACAESAFHARHGVTIEQACAMAQRMVEDVVAGYKRYFEAEADVVAVAERYDALQEWAHKSKSLFAEVHSVQGTANAFDEMVQAYFHSEGEATPSASDDVTGPWADKMHRAKEAWLGVQAQRHIVERFQQVVGHQCTCKVCFSATVNAVLVPCGHTLCKVCAEQVHQCPFCNTAFYSVQDVYFG